LKVLLAVDVQRDFFQAAPGAWEIIDPLRQRAARADLVVASWHVVDGQPAEPIQPEILALADIILTSITGPEKLHSAFDGTLLEAILASYRDEVTVQVGGLGINDCVKLTALDAAALGYRVEVLLSCTRGRGGEQARRELAAGGCELVHPRFRETLTAP
jgi:nicotinamidase-related amidase